MRCVQAYTHPVRILTLFVFIAYNVQAQSVEEQYRKAEVLDRKLEAAGALALYLEVEKSQPENANVLIAIARQYRHLMADASSKEEKLRLGKIALSYGERAAVLAPNNSDAQLSVAITYGRMLALKSTKERIDISRRIKASVDRALKVDPGNDTAWHVQGRWHQGYAELSSVKRAMGEMAFGKLPESTYEDAARSFEKAAKANPRRLMHVIELGITYGKMGRTQEARRLIEKGLAMPNTEKDDPVLKQRARVELEGLQTPAV